MTDIGAVFAGLIGGIIVVFSIEFVKEAKIDDAIGVQFMELLVCGEL